jgi:4-hydroxybenzoyl-CoA reductase subunit beta
MTAPLAPFSLVLPANVAAAVAAYHDQPDSRYLGGGTDLLVNLRRDIKTVSQLIDITIIPELCELACGRSGARIGASVSIARLAAAPQIRARYPALSQAAAAVAGPAHRNAATVGGNLCLDTRCIYYNQSDWWRSALGFCLKHRGEVCHVAPQGQRCHASFSGDLAPALLVLGAEVEVAGRAARRQMPLAHLYQEDGRAHLTLAPGELIVAVLLPADPPPSAYEKVRLRGSVDFPLAGVAVALRLAADELASLRIAVTGTNSCPIMLEGTDALLGRPLDARALLQLDKLVQKQVHPMRTTLTQANYRRHAAAALARRLAERLASAARCAGSS